VKIVIPDDYQDMVHRLSAFLSSAIMTSCATATGARSRSAGRRLADADVVVAIRERVAFSRTPHPAAEAPPDRIGRAQNYAEPCRRQARYPVSTGVSNSPVAPAGSTLALIVAARATSRSRLSA
jgi:hypothetical protein